MRRATTKRAIQCAMAYYAGQPIPPKPAPRKNGRPEAAAPVEVLRTLRGHPAVAWCERQYVGAYKDGDRFIRQCRPGCSDALGQLVDGRFLAVEVKAAAGLLSEAQRIFIDRVRAAEGFAFLECNAAWHDT